MSQSTTNSSKSTVRESSEQTRVFSTGSLSLESLFRAVQTVSFWTAITLPFLSIPFLFSGIETTAEQQAFLAMLFLNVVALQVGHTYNQ